MADAFSFPADRYLLIGTVGKAHGLRGDVTLRLYSRQPENLRAYSRLVLVSTEGGLSAPLRIRSCRARKKMAIVGLESVCDRNHADRLRGMGVLVDKADIPREDTGAYWYQFDGLPVTTVTGRPLGRVERIFSNGAQDILVVRDKGREYLIPILDSIIVRHTGEELVIDPPPGLLEINSGVADEGDD